MDIPKRRTELEAAKAQLLAQLNGIEGALQIIKELEAEAAPAQVATADALGLNGTEPAGAY